MTGFPINPPRAPIADAQGRVSNEWYRFFVAIQRMIGGPVDPFDSGTLMADKGRPENDPEDFLLAPHRPVEAEEALAPPAIPVEPNDLLPPPAGRFVPVGEGQAWADATGTAARTAYASYAGQTVSAGYVQAEAQATDDAVKAISQALVALINDLKANGSLS